MNRNRIIIDMSLAAGLKKNRQFFSDRELQKASDLQLTSHLI